MSKYIQQSIMFKDFILFDSVTQGIQKGNIGFIRTCSQDKAVCLLSSILFWQEEMGEDGRRIPSRRSYGLQRIWYASKLEGTRLAGLLLLEVLPSGYVNRVMFRPSLQP